jgi:putative nucleotidyltransferase with HDIG domain
MVTGVARVLFVDTDRNLLQELDLALGSAPGDWSVVSAMSAAEACDQLSRGAFDAVVADAGVLGTDGAPFLEMVAERQPAAVRLLLSSGHGPRATVPDSSAHQHLLKPLRAGAVFARLGQTLRLGQLLSDASIKAVVSRLRSVPSLPPVYMAIMTELRDVEASPRKIGELMSKDGGMAAKILQLVNSPFFGFRVVVTEPTQAVQLLGLETVRGLVLSAHVFEQLDLRTVKRFRLGKVWRHSLATAASARAIARSQRVTADVMGETFTAALLHDLGKLVLAGSLPEDYGVIVGQAEADTTPTWMVERDMVGTTHAEVGAYLLGLWGLPTPIVEAVAWHHRPSEALSESFCPIGAVHAANIIAQRLHQADIIAAPSQLDDSYLERCHVAEQIPAWTAAAAVDGVRS